jgi:peroxiredoxin
VRDVLPTIVRVITENGTGTGTIVNESGDILTCQHIVEDSKNVTIVLSDGSKYSGQVVIADKVRDLAIIRLTSIPANLTAASLGNSEESDKLQLGQDIYILGYPYSMKGSASITKGIVSAFRIVASTHIIQTDAAANPGNSGGPMINCDGKVIGIVAFRYSIISEGTNFAIGINEAKDIMRIAVSSAPTITTPVTPPAVAHSEPTPVVTSPPTPTVEIPPGTNANSLPSKPTCTYVGCIAPDFTLSTMDGKSITLSTLKGKTVIILFLKTRCSTCAELMKYMQQVYDLWPREQLEILVILSHEKTGDIQSWINLYKISCPVLLDSDGRLINKYGPSMMPASYFLDADQTIKMKKFGSFATRATEIDALLRLIALNPHS